MGLQVRLRHALGERLLEIPPKPVDAPVVVGRAADADVQVPSVNVGSRHAVLFVHDGQWAVQDVSSTHPTYVNGEPLRGPRALNSGDVVVLGTDANAPLIEIDPDGVMLSQAQQAQPSATAPTPPAFAGGYAGHPAGGPVAPAPPPFGYPPPSRMVSTAARSAQPVQMYAAPVPYETTEDPHAHVPDPQADDEAAWTAAAAGASRRRRRPQKTSEAAIGVAVVAAIGIIGVVGYLVHQRRQEAELAAGLTRVEPAKALPAPAPESTKHVPKSIFTDDGAPGQPAPDSTPPRTGYDRLEDTAKLTKKPAPPPDLTDDQPPVAPGSAATPEGGGPAAPKQGDGVPRAIDGQDGVISETDPTFKRVENAYYSPDPAKALLTFDAYEEEFPNQHTQRIAEYREAMLDKIWWERIDSLFEKRQALTQGIKETQLAIKEETEDAHKKTVLEPRLEEQKSRLATLGEKLAKEMGYRATTPPPITEEAAMAEFRAKRDKTLYEPWKKRVLKHIRDKHGDYPWANEK
jgi:pSer/pThr/pTyr-binding forkhead associated (FHA) protein